MTVIGDNVDKLMSVNDPFTVFAASCKSFQKAASYSIPEAKLRNEVSSSLRFHEEEKKGYDVPEKGGGVPFFGRAEVKACTHPAEISSQDLNSHCHTWRHIRLGCNESMRVLKPLV